MGQSTKSFQLKLVLRSLKKINKNLVKKIFGDHQIFWWFGSREHVNDFFFKRQTEKKELFLANKKLGFFFNCSNKEKLEEKTGQNKLIFGVLIARTSSA